MTTDSDVKAAHPEVRKWIQDWSTYITNTCYHGNYPQDATDALAALLAQTRADEREACAKVADRLSKCSPTRAENERCVEAAAAIRARSTQPAKEG